MVTQKRIDMYCIPEGGFRILPLLPSQLLEIGWYPGKYALDTFGQETRATDDWAVQWSITGACQAVYYRQTFNPEVDEQLYFAIKSKLHGRIPHEWECDDGVTQEEVIEIVRSAEQMIGLEQIMPTPYVRWY